jgi:hypothetical protein
MTDLLQELDGFVIQDDDRTVYISAVCRVCKMRWLVPRDERRRTRVAISLLCAHVEAHGDEVEPPRKVAYCEANQRMDNGGERERPGGDFAGARSTTIGVIADDERESKTRRKKCPGVPTRRSTT